MGLMDKLKGILFDEEIEEIPEIKNETKLEIKKEIKEEKNPIKEIKVPKEEPSEREVIKTEPSFTFPIDFDDEEIEEKPRVKHEEVKRPVKKEYSSNRDYSSFLNKKDDRKQFKPTPIISPVYGILDQNYKKEDVIVKKDVLRRPNELSLEEVRKRAFGSLEDDIEQNLTVEVVKDEEIKPEIKEEKNNIIVEEPVDKHKTIGELIEEDSMNIDIPKIESINDDEEEYNSSDATENETEEPKNSIDDLFNREEEIKKEENNLEEEKEEDIDDEEADLFSLIDSMYEEKGE